MLGVLWARRKGIEIWRPADQLQTMARVHLTTSLWERPFSAAYDFARDLSSFAASYVDPPAQPDVSSVPQGDGHKVIVLPGIMTGDFTTYRLVGWLKKIGYDAQGWGPGINWGPTASIIKHVDDLVSTAHTASGRKVSLVGRSLGGIYVREYAKRFPEHVARVITLGTPLHFPVKTPLSPFEKVLANFYDESITERLGGVPENPPVPLTAMYSKRDGIVPWQACLAEEGPLAQNLEIDSAHTVMGENPRAMRIVAFRLADKPFSEPLTKP
jgi:dienelactone hydrolase